MFLDYFSARKCRAIIIPSLTGRPNSAAFASRPRVPPSGRLPDATRSAGGVFTSKGSHQGVI
jgi:hypothetical protein